jgi:hypothetical protein
VFVVCPDCGADQQEVGKYCENCGRLITADDVAAGVSSPPPPPPPARNPWDPPVAAPPVAAPPVAAPGPSAPLGRAHFAVVQNGQAQPTEGFTLTQPGEFLVGRPNNETGTGVDIDVRQWVQPLDIDGQKQYLVHRNQCFLGLTPDGVVTIRGCAGVEGDTLVKPVEGSTFLPLPQLGTMRPLRPDSTYPLHVGDRLYMGDPEAILANQSGDARAAGTYLILELLAA